MERILISWIAKNNDFKDGKVDKENSPNYLFHKHFYNYDKHIILYASGKDELPTEHLFTTLKKDFPDHQVELVNMQVIDVISLPEIKTKVEVLDLVNNLMFFFIILPVFIFFF